MLFEWLDYLCHKIALKMPQGIFFPAGFFFFFLLLLFFFWNGIKQQQKCSPLDTIQATAMFAVHRRLFLITAIVSRSFSGAYGSNWYGCRPYFLLAFSDNVLFSSKSLLSQDKFRWSSSLAMFQLMHTRRNKPENLKSNQKLHFSSVQVKFSIFHGRYWENLYHLNQ